MKSFRVLPALVAASFMIALAAVPAFALESQFNAFYQVQWIFSDFNGSTTTDGFYLPEGKEDAPSANFIEQRVRLAYTAKANDNLKLVTKFEMDYSYWGNNSYEVRRNGGGALGSDGINFETKHLFLDLNIPSTRVNAKIGMMGFDDRFEGIFLSTDVAGILLSAPFGNFSGALAFYRLYDDGTNAVRGKETADLLGIDLGWQIKEGVKVGCAYYYVTNDIDDVDLTLNTLGASAEITAGPAVISGFFLYQFGDMGDTDIKAYVANAGATVKAGPGTLRAEFMYASGDDDPADATIKSLVTVSGEYGYYSNHLVILGRDEYAMTTDNAIVYDVGNNGQGSILASAGYDLAVGKGALGATLGFGWVAKDPGKHEGKMLGTEINVDYAYPVFDNLTAVARGAYLVLGNYYDGVAANGDDPNNPWDARVILQYAF